MAIKHRSYILNKAFLKKKKKKKHLVYCFVMQQHCPIGDINKLGFLMISAGVHVTLRSVTMLFLILSPPVAHMKVWYLSHSETVKAKASLEPAHLSKISLFVQTLYETGGRLCQRMQRIEITKISLIGRVKACSYAHQF